MLYVVIYEELWKKSCFLLCYHVFIVLVSSFLKYFFSQNNSTAVWLKLTGKHNEKTWFLRIELTVFAY